MTVFIVDDEASVRRALGRLLRAEGFEVVAFASGAEFLTGHGQMRPACVVLDMAMPGTNGLELQQALVEMGSTLPIIFLTGRADVPMCAQAMKRGAVDFLTKPVNDEDLLTAVRRALTADHADSESRAGREGTITRLASLTPREREVLDLVITGLLNKQIAAELGTVEKTIKVHRGRVMEKMGAQSVAELVRMMERVSR
jgi:FixJ family two-component response regulator